MRKALIALGALLVLSVASATTVVPMSVEALASVSSHVLEGTALQSWSQWNSAHTLIVTYTRFQVLRTLKGQAPSTVIVQQLGGKVGEITQKVAGVRHWNPGEQAVLFLRPNAAGDGSMVVTGLVQGNFLFLRGINGEAVVSNGMPEVSEYKVGSGQVSTYRGSALRLQELEARVQKAVQQ
jgi:hypothetical protein